MSLQIGFIGLGAMGIEMTKHLQTFLSTNNYPSLIFYNRTAEKGKPLLELGAVQEESPKHVIWKSDIVFFMLSTDDAIKSMIKDNVIGLGDDIIKGKILVDCSTVHPDTASENYKLVSQHGAHFVSSPVFGATPAAAAAKLIFVPSGNKQAVDTLEPFMKAMGRSIMYLGEDVEKSLAMKITGNVFIVGLMELSAEVQVLGEKVGLAPELITQWAQEFAGPTIGLYFQKNSGGIYDPGANGIPLFTVDNGLKDSGHAMSLAKDHGVNLPTLEAARSNLYEAKKLKGDRSNLDTSSVYGALRVQAGLDFENEAVKKREAEENK